MPALDPQVTASPSRENATEIPRQSSLTVRGAALARSKSRRPRPSADVTATSPLGENATNGFSKPESKPIGGAEPASRATSTRPSSDALASSEPSSENATDTIASGARRTSLRPLGFASDHMCAAPSIDAVASCPTPLVATVITPAAWRSTDRTGAAGERTSHTRTTPSFDPVTIWSPLGENAIVTIGMSCSGSARTSPHPGIA